MQEHSFDGVNYYPNVVDYREVDFADFHTYIVSTYNDTPIPPGHTNLADNTVSFEYCSANVYCGF